MTWVYGNSAHTLAECSKVIDGHSFLLTALLMSILIQMERKFILFGFLYIKIIRTMILRAIMFRKMF